ncbi:ethanolaminephosphotransferase 1-like [Haliotis rubra]|uniref:ethanolaminephosphotransferase 1-like n=1 Tax=Haliotis rubra TaxID=36100 RepID=UPI001EE5E332|nr:ethanolaminephosphotransferase 1-like [Haliotis rubra]
MATFGYLSKDVLTGFDNYKYSAVDTSPVANYICHPFWNWVVQFYPLWIAPNVLTLSGFLLLLLSFFVMTYYDPDFYASSRDYPDYGVIPNWVWLMGAVNNFMSHNLDGTDGKQARRTGTSSPLGELFDHGLDSMGALFIPVALYSIFGRSEMSVDVFRCYYILLGIMTCFLLSHWEKYNTGILFLPWGYDISQIAMTFVYLITYFGTYEIWKFTVPVIDWTAAECVVMLCYMGFFFLTFPPSLYNLYVSYRDKTGKMRSFSEAMRPLVSTALLFTMLLLWANVSTYRVLDNHPRLFYWTTGAAFSNIACNLIIAQMSNTRCELINTLLLPLFTIVFLCGVFSLGIIEFYLLWSYCIYVTVSHVIFGVSVVCEMCEHFNIKAFTIPVKKS